MSLMASFCAVLLSPRDALDQIWDIIESVSEGFPTYFRKNMFYPRLSETADIDKSG